MQVRCNSTPNCQAKEIGRGLPCVARITQVRCSKLCITTRSENTRCFKFHNPLTGVLIVVVVNDVRVLRKKKSNTSVFYIYIYTSVSLRKVLHIYNM